MADWWQSDSVVADAPAPVAAADPQGNWWEAHDTLNAPSIPASSIAAPKSSKPFGDRLQEVWDNPTPGGALWIAKNALEGMQNAVEGSKAAMQDMRNPVQTEGDAFRLNNAQDRTAQGAMQAASVLTPGAPRGTGGVFAAPFRSATAIPQILPEEVSSGVPSLVRQAQDIGVNVPNFMASDNMLTKRLAAGVKNIPGAGDPIYKAAQGVTEGLGNAARGIQEGMGTGSPQVAGGVAKDLISNWITNSSKAPVEDAYKTVDSLINPDVRVPLSNTADEVAKIMAERANAKIPGQSKAVKLLQDAIGGPQQQPAPTQLPAWAQGVLNKGGAGADRLNAALTQSGIRTSAPPAPSGLNYPGVKTLRSFLGDQTDQQLIAQGINPKEAKRLYGPLTRDMENIIQQSGGEPAVNAWREANALARQTIQQREELSKIVGASGDAAPEAVFARLQSYAGSKSSADINRLMLARKAVGEESWPEVGSAVISRMGRDPQGNFSPDRFLTAYGNLSQGGKNVLFSGNQRDALDKINNVSAAFREDITKFSNPSGTAHNAIGAGLVMEMFQHPLNIIGSLVGGRVLADALAKPATSREVANFSQAYRNATIVPSAANKALLQTAASSLSRALAQNLGLAKNMANGLQGAIPAPADQQPQQGVPRRNYQPNANGIDQKT